MRNFAVCLLILLLLPLGTRAFQQATSTSDIITVGGSVTETVFALGLGDRVLATDASSTFPEPVNQLPRVPYMRNLTAEGMLSLQPGILLVSEHAGPPPVLQQIIQAGVPVHLIPETESMEGVVAKIRMIGEILNRKDQAEELINVNRRQYDRAGNIRTTLKHQPRVLFVLDDQSGNSFMVAGAQTSAQTMTELAGGINALSGFIGYKTVSNEALLMADPEFILVMSSRLDKIRSGFRGHPVLRNLSAVRSDSFVAMDGNLLLGFGPRFGEAILTLMSELHPGQEVNP